MKDIDAGAGGRKSFRSWASGLASGAMAALVLISASGAKAKVTPETFTLSGELNTDFGSGSLVSFSGTIGLDFTNDFADETVVSFQITVPGHPVFNESPSVVLSASTTGTIRASNSVNDTLTLLFTTPLPGTWNHFTTAQFFFGDLVFGGVTGSLLGAEGDFTHSSGPAIVIVPPVVDPPPPPPSVAVPELSTWAMMLIGLAGLGLAAKGRRALAMLSARA